MNLDYVVVTSVTRDDLPDGGAGQFTETIRRIRAAIPNVRVEVLIPDFLGKRDSLQKILDAGPDVLNHNIETVASLYQRVRPQASYERSLTLLDRGASSGGAVITKSGMMLGIGESDSQILKTLKDLRSVNCSFLTIGQYLQPSKDHLPVHRFISPEAFEKWRTEALDLGFRQVASGPFVRSSYHARDMQAAYASSKDCFDNRI
jgi:lipoic acid synthetase